MRIAEARLQLTQQIANSRRAVDRELIANRKMQPHVQKWIFVASSGVWFKADRGAFIGQYALVLRVRSDHVCDLRFERRERRARQVFGPGLRIGEARSEEHTSELQSHVNLVCRLLLEKK